MTSLKFNQIVNLYENTFMCLKFIEYYISKKILKSYLSDWTQMRSDRLDFNWNNKVNDVDYQHLTAENLGVNYH